MSIQGATIGLQIMDEATGDWVDVGGVQEAAFTDLRAVGDVPMPLDHRRSFTMEFTTRPSADGREPLRDLLARLDREARWARRAWLTHPYRMRGLH